MNGRTSGRRSVLRGRPWQRRSDYATLWGYATPQPAQVFQRSRPGPVGALAHRGPPVMPQAIGLELLALVVVDGLATTPTSRDIQRSDYLRGTSSDHDTGRYVASYDRACGDYRMVADLTSGEHFNTFSEPYVCANDDWLSTNGRTRLYSMIISVQYRHEIADLSIIANFNIRSRDEADPRLIRTPFPILSTAPGLLAPSSLRRSRPVVSDAPISMVPPVYSSGIRPSHAVISEQRTPRSRNQAQQSAERIHK